MWRRGSLLAEVQPRRGRNTRVGEQSLRQASAVVVKLAAVGIDIEGTLRCGGTRKPSVRVPAASGRGAPGIRGDGLQEWRSSRAGKPPARHAGPVSTARCKDSARAFRFPAHGAAAPTSQPRRQPVMPKYLEKLLMTNDVFVQGERRGRRRRRRSGRGRSRRPPGCRRDRRRWRPIRPASISESRCRSDSPEKQPAGPGFTGPRRTPAHPRSAGNWTSAFTGSETGFPSSRRRKCRLQG
jgi:hypothetical protein